MRYVTPQLTNVGEVLEVVLGSTDPTSVDNGNYSPQSPNTTDGTLSADV